ncbi:MAG: nuclear transport factor 2 family protein [Actinomycetota bacterium]
MAGAMTGVVQGMFEALDKSDADAAIMAIGSEVQAIDELSRRWMRSRDDLVGYLRELMSSVADVHSEMHDVHEIEWGDTGLVTFWLEQDYTIEGEREHISAPSTVVLRREGGAWKVALFHSAPLPPEA